MKEMENLNKEIIKTAIEQYQCSGCVSGSDISCFKSNEIAGIGCGKHCSGTMIGGIGNIFLGLPKGFCRLGDQLNLKPNIFETYEKSDWKYDMWNIPTWKYLNEEGHTIVRGMMPRKNENFLHIFLENCMDKINCLEITKEDIEKMD